MGKSYITHITIDSCSNSIIYFKAQISKLYYRRFIQRNFNRRIHNLVIFYLNLKLVDFKSPNQNIFIKGPYILHIKVTNGFMEF